MPSVLSRLPLYALLVLIMVVGCDQQTNKTDEQTEQGNVKISEQSTQPPENEPAQPADSAPNIETETTSTLSPPAAELQIEEVIEGINSEDKAAENKLAQDRQSIVSDLGFSGSTALPIEPNVESYCLDQKTVSNVSVEQACNAISDRLASVSMQSCSSAMLTPTGCDSAKGFPILVREFPPMKDKLPRGRILLIGGTHGDELTSVSVTFRWIEKLNKYHSGLFHWHIVPLMNPDGVLKKSASRTNHNGVDLNRNLPSDDWERNALSYWENRGGKNPRKYPGEKAASEPETQWLIDEINTFKPDAIISVHAPYGVVDFDALLLNTAPKSLGKLHLNLLGTYPGSLGNYAGINRDIPVITLELPHSWVMPSDNETSKIWEDIVTWLSKNINNTPDSEQTAATQ